MAKRRVFNVTRGCHLALNQAETAVEVCSAVWVEYGVSIRDVTLTEAIAARNQQAAQRRPTVAMLVGGYAELPGIKYEPGADRMAAYRRERDLAVNANKFARLAVC